MITVYTRKGCSQCEICKRIYKNYNIAHEVHDINDMWDKDKQALFNKARDKGLMSLPIVVQDGEVIKWESIVHQKD